MLRRLALLAALLSAPFSALATPPAVPDIDPSAQAVTVSPRPVARIETLPAARWGDRDRAARWSRATLAALRGHAAVLPRTVPRDIAQWCPAYRSADRAQREAFWLGLVSSLAKHESTFRPTAVGGGGKWYGLMQILPGTARGYGCTARTGAALKDGPKNLACALRIMAVTVPRDGVISHRMRGVAADWGPFHSRKKRQDMAAWIRKQSYCRGLARSLKPVARPFRTLAFRSTEAITP